MGKNTGILAVGTNEKYCDRWDTVVGHCSSSDTMVEDLRQSEIFRPNIATAGAIDAATRFLAAVS